MYSTLFMVCPEQCEHSPQIGLGAQVKAIGMNNQNRFDSRLVEDDELSLLHNKSWKT